MVAKLVNNGRPSHMEPTATGNALMGHSQLAFLRISFVPCVGAETTEVSPSSPFSCYYRRSYECCHEIPFASCFFFHGSHRILLLCSASATKEIVHVRVFGWGLWGVPILKWTNPIRSSIPSSHWSASSGSIVLSEILLSPLACS